MLGQFDLWSVGHVPISAEAVPRSTSPEPCAHPMDALHAAQFLKSVKREYERRRQVVHSVSLSGLLVLEHVNVHGIWLLTKRVPTRRGVVVAEAGAEGIRLVPRNRLPGHLGGIVTVLVDAGRTLEA